MLYVLINAVNIFFQLLIYLIFARIIMSWFIRNPYANKISMILIQLTEPILAPFRRLMSRFGATYGLDFSPILALIALQIVNQIIVTVLRMIF